MAEQLSLVGIDRLGNVRANVSSLTVDVPGCAWFRDWRTGVWGRLSGEHGVGWRTGREVGAGRTVMVDMTVVGTEGRLLTAVGGGEDVGGEEHLGCKFSVPQTSPKENLKLTTAQNHGKTELFSTIES